MGVGVWCSGVPESAHCGHLTDKCANLPESVVAQPGAISGWHAAQANTRRRVEADLTATTGPAPASQRTLAIIGDSITEALAGYRVGHYHRGYYSKPFPGKLTEYWRPKNISVLPWGIAADRTEQVLWRLTHHELAGVPQAPPSAVMLWIGTNNLARGHTPSETVAGIKAIVAILLQLFPGTPLLLMSLLPRADCKLLPPAARCTLGEMGNVINNEVIKVNALMQEYAASVDATYVDCYSTFADPLTTRLPKDLFPDLLHPNLKVCRASRRYSPPLPHAPCLTTGLPDDVG